jgi:hypothetical protein
LRDSGLEPDGHGKEACELAEDQLLAGFSSDGLVEELCNFAGIQVCLETPDAGLAEAGYFLGEVECFVDGFEGIVVGA